MPYPVRVLARVIAHADLMADGCLVSRYSVGSHGYAQVGWNEDGKRAVTLCHRVVAAAAFGDIPAGVTVDHTCKNKKCVNVGHLRLLSNFDNARRTNGRDWPLGQCINGHDDSELTTRGGKRVCRPCSAEWQRQYRRRKTAAAC